MGLTYAAAPLRQKPAALQSGGLRRFVGIWREFGAAFDLGADAPADPNLFRCPAGRAREALAFRDGDRSWRPPHA